MTFTWSIWLNGSSSVLQPARREHEWVAAGEDDFPDLLVLADIGQRRVKLVSREQPVPGRADHFTAEAEAAIDRADMHGLEQHPIRIAMHDALDGREAPVGNRVGAFFRQGFEFAGVGQELPGHRPLRIALDQRRHFGRHGDRIAGGNGLKAGEGVTSPAIARSSTELSETPALIMARTPQRASR